MIFFITVLRALAACLITNSHFTGIYPTDLIANGGLIGDVLFFAVSGYCLANVKYELSVAGFVRWYGKRIWRIYPPVLLMTALYMLLGAYTTEEHGLFWWFFYPTYYHFVASIMVLYIPFFFIMKLDVLRKRIGGLMAAVGLVWLAVYFTVYDSSYYHIDTVREPMIRFLYMESILLGAWFRLKGEKLRNHFRPLYPLLTLLAFVLYFGSKLLFSKRAAFASLQFLNQIAIFVLLFFLFRTFCGLDGRLERLPSPLKRGTRFLSDMTLEIYVVQYVIIDAVRALGLAFPLNFLLLTACILLAAFVLHKLCAWIYRTADRALTGRKGA